ncbi:MAG: leucine-rich repeat domain-containing protein, partial [Clostridia bacterium]|nr:leucine-rich repeat domain-containing protein [Clostridia bacterium]
AFGYCSFTTIDIPDSVTSIGAAAFKGCYALSSVEIPEGVTVIGDYAFGGCDALASVTVPEGGLEAIGLSGSTSLTSAKIMDGVVRISSDFFAGCVNLTEVTIPESVKLISSRAFNDCTLLTDVYFGGTEAQWAEVAVRKGNDPLLNATVHFAE